MRIEADFVTFIGCRVKRTGFCGWGLCSSVRWQQRRKAVRCGGSGTKSSDATMPGSEKNADSLSEGWRAVAGLEGPSARVRRGARTFSATERPSAEAFLLFCGKDKLWSCSAQRSFRTALAGACSAEGGGMPFGTRRFDET